MTPGPGLAAASAAQGGRVWTWDVVIAAAVVAAALHLYVFARESLLHSRTSTRRMLEIDAVHAEAVRLWAFHQGVYHALLAAITGSGVIAALTHATTVATALLTASGAAMVVTALALLIADPRRARLAGFCAQALPPLIALAALRLG